MRRFQSIGFGLNKKSGFAHRTRQGLFESIRVFFWNYPEKIFPHIEKEWAKLKNSYAKAQPLASILIILLLLSGVVISVYYVMTYEKVTQKQEVVEGILGMPDDLNPIFVPKFQVQKDIYQLVFDRLFKVLPDGGVVGDLVENWEFKDNGKTLAITLRPNIKWQDGWDFTSADVKYTIDLYKSLNGEDSYYDTVTDVEVEVISALELTIKKSRASASFLETITWPVLPKHILESVQVSDLNKIDFARKPIGTGPYMLESWTNEKIILSRNDGYWNKQSEIEKISFKSYGSEKNLIHAIEAGKIDSTIEITGANALNLEKIKWISVMSAPLYRRYWGVYFNMDGPEIFKEKRIREALSASFNRQEIIEKALKGFATESKGPIYELSWAYNPDAKRYTYNPEDVKKLLEDVGYKIPEGELYYKKDDKVLEYELAYVSNPIQDEVAKIIQEGSFALGIKVNLNALSYQEFRDTRLLSRNFDTILFGVESLLDPDHFILWHSTQNIWPGRNFSSYKSSYIILEDLTRVDDILEKGKESMNKDVRKELYQKMQTYILDEAPVAFLYHPDFIYVLNNRITGIDLSTVTLPEERFDSIANWKIE